jgi:hypothetical protein
VSYEGNLVAISRVKARFKASSISAGLNPKGPGLLL